VKAGGEKELTMKTIRIEGKDTELLEGFPVRFSCMEHIEDELDDYVNDFEAAPHTYRAASIETEDVDKRCRVCGEPGQIALLREKGM
jgi:CxxH/CxxC protein (TIGR04129 family)